MKFGTDGLRGRANTEIGAELALRLGNAAASTLGPRVAVAMDTRPSGPMLEAAVVAGVAAAGGRALRCGVLPTPGLSALVAELDADAGIMITASHNPARDNGLKVLARGGGKLEAAGRAALERALGEALVNATEVGGVEVVANAQERYVAAVLAAARGPGRWLTGHTVVVDTANGAATGIAGRVLAALGARVIAIGDGRGDAINAGVGAVHPEAMVAAVRSHGAAAGIALDGDADRVVLCDATGRIVDGDGILYLLGAGSSVVGTIMSNAGLERALAARGTRLVRAAVGDANVADAMRAHAASLGAEPSGHVLFADGLPTGCGLLAALRALAPDPSTLAARLADYRPTFQAHAVGPRKALDGLAAAIAELEVDGARVVARPSGTEPVVRLMVEHDDARRARSGVDTLVRLLGELP